MDDEIAIPADDPRLLGLRRIIGIMDRLRGEGGCPWDLQQAECDALPEEPDPFSMTARPRADADLTRRAAELLAAAEFPVIVAGNGALISGAGAAVEALAQELGAPVATSFVAKGLIPEDHPLSVGIVGWLGHPVAHEFIRERADIILAIGYRFADQSTSYSMAASTNGWTTEYVR